MSLQQPVWAWQLAMFLLPEQGIVFQIFSCLLRFSGLGLFMVMLASLGFIQRFVFPAFGYQDFYFNGWLMTIPLSLSLLIGISCAFVAVPTQSSLQAAVPEELRGKVFGAQNTAMSAASTIPVILAGFR